MIGILVSLGALVVGGVWAVWMIRPLLERKEEVQDPSTAPASAPVVETATPPVEVEEAPVHAEPAPALKLVPVAGRHFGARYVVRMDGTPDHTKVRIFDEILDVPMPQAVLDFDAWFTEYLAAEAEAQPALEARGEVLAQARLAALEELLATDPQAVLLAALTPAERCFLPESWSPYLENWVAGVGRYEVVPVGPPTIEAEGSDSRAWPQREQVQVYFEGTSERAPVALVGAIYGSRLARVREEDASLFGVAVGGRVALHEGDFVFFPGEAVDPAQKGHIAVLHRGEWSFVEDPTALPGHLHRLMGQGEAAVAPVTP